MNGRAITLVRSWLGLAVASLVSGCVATNPAWDGPASTSEAGSTANDGGTSVDPSTGASDSSVGASTTGIAADTTVAEHGGSADVSDDAASSSDASTGVPVVCDGELPAEGACPESCGGCADGSCPIVCGGMPACPPMAMCPDGWPCEVSCTGKDACKNKMIVCPADHPCEVTCSGEHSCEGVTVHCGGGPCHVQCTGHPQACKGLEVVCGAGDGAIDCDLQQDMPSPRVDPSPGSSCACAVNGC